MKENSFTWHEVSEKEKESIRKEAKAILENFSKELSKIENKGLQEGIVERGNFEREEGKGESVDIDRKKMFDNFRIKDSESDRESEKILKDSRHTPKKDRDAQDLDNLGAAKSDATLSRRKKDKDFAGFIIAEKGGWE